MKKWVVLSITVTMLLTLLAGCKASSNSVVSTQKNKPITNDPYKIYLESNLLEDYSTEQLEHDVIQENHIEVSENVPNKTVTLFGQTITLCYKETWQSNRRTRNLLFYDVRDSQTGALYWAGFDSATGALRIYYNSQAGNDRSYQSEVNEHSSEAEFLAYAKKLVSQYASVEGCAVEIETRFYEYKEEYGYYGQTGITVDGYVNNAENIPDFYAVYTFTFYKTIDGIRLWDTNTIEISNTGEVCQAGFYLQDDVYEDYFDIDIDMEQAERLVHSACDGEIVSALLVATTDGALWLHFMVYWGIEGAGSCNTYAIPIVGGI